jgi:hypothetical protein
MNVIATWKAVRRLAHGTGAGLALTWAGVLGGPVAAAQPCPDVEVIFARGTAEAPGSGAAGQAVRCPYLQKYAMPPAVSGPVFAPRTIELCAAGDPVCGPGGNTTAHGSYPVNGMVNQGAGFAATRL